jgi:hypothetical protein
MDGGVPTAPKRLQKEPHIGLVVDDQDLDPSFHVPRVNGTFYAAVTARNANCADTEFSQSAP